MQWRTAKPEDLPQIRAAFAAIIERMNRDGVPIWDDSYPAMAFPGDIARGSLYILDDGGAVAAAFALFALEGADDVQWRAPAARAVGLPFEILRQLDRIAGPHIAAKAVQPLVDLPDLFAQRQPAEQVLGALRR